MEKEEKLQLGIYRIDTENVLFAENNNFIDVLSKKIQDKKSNFKKQELQEGLTDNFKIDLLYKWNPLRPKWKNFLENVVKHNQEILEKDRSFAESFIILIQNEDSKNLYAVVGGLLGYHSIQDFVDDDFGVDILSRLIKKEDKIIKSVKEKSVMGGILGSTKYFRKNYNFFENDGFGKIYQELKVCLDKKILKDHFGFSEEELKKESVCVAKASFKINKSISFEHLLNIIKGCEYVLGNSGIEPISINNVEKIIKKKEHSLVQKLENELFDQMWQRYSKEDSYNIDFDLCHKDFEKYLTASKYIVKKNNSSENYLDDFERLENIDELFERIKKLEEKPKNQETFNHLIKSLKIYSYSNGDDENELTGGWLIRHVFGDIALSDQRYFLIDNNWYKIKEDFIKDLNDSCKSFIMGKNNFDNGLSKKWDYEGSNKEKRSENFYNGSYIGEDKTIVLDKITPENIEPCDILKWDDNNLYFYHIKAGFGNTMRDLCSQIFIAAYKIKKDLNSSKKEYINEIYNRLQSKIGSKNEYFSEAGNQTNIITKKEFMNLFGDRELIFILAVLDTAVNERSIKEDICDFNSNIAKFSLQELVKGMRGIDVNFKIAQINRKK